MRAVLFLACFGFGLAPVYPFIYLDESLVSYKKKRNECLFMEGASPKASKYESFETMLCIEFKMIFCEL